MKAINVKDESKERFIQKKKELADALGIDENQVSASDALDWLCTSQPTSKGERFRIACDRFKQEIMIIAGTQSDEKTLCKLLDIVRCVLRNSIDDQKQAMAYMDGLSTVVDAVRMKFPTSQFPIKKRINDDADD